MPEFQDITSLALLAGVLYMGERWLNKLTTHLTSHLDRQNLALEKCLTILLTIQDSFLDAEAKK